MQCEICGSKIVGKAYQVIIDRAKLVVCEKCAKTLKAPKYELTPSKTTTTKPTPTPSVRYTPPRRRMPRLTPEYEIVEDFAERIKEAREAMGLTRELLARMVGEKVSTIKRIEDGTLVPTIDLARKLERVLKIVLVVETLPSIESEEYKTRKYELTLGDIVELKRKKK